ncbi:MAG: hypothetical protein PUF51_03690 [Bifidobacteriaceae bacterium]|nr:hypothetical protein [Bifidobacteriaceae bacterium]
METEQLRQLVTIADEGTMIAAAERSCCTKVPSRSSSDWRRPIACHSLQST